MIEARLKGKSQSPQAVVSLAHCRSSTVLVSGQAKSPGRYQLGARETLLDIVADTGGTTGATAGGGDNPEDILVRFTPARRRRRRPLDIRSHSSNT